MRLTYYLFLFCFSSSFAQNFTLTEFLNIRSKSLAEVTEILSSESWTCLSEEPETDEKLAYAYFVFLKSEFTDRGQAFLNYYYSNESEIKRLEVQVFQKNRYSNYIAELEKLGCKIIKSKVIDQDIIEYYQGETTTIRVKILAEKKEESTKTWYTFFIMTNDDYNTNYTND